MHLMSSRESRSEAWLTFHLSGQAGDSVHLSGQAGDSVKDPGHGGHHAVVDHWGCSALRGPSAHDADHCPAELLVPATVEILSIFLQKLSGLGILKI